MPPRPITSPQMKEDILLSSTYNAQIDTGPQLPLHLCRYWGEGSPFGLQVLLGVRVRGSSFLCTCASKIRR